MTKVNIVGRPVLLWVLDHLGITKEDSIFLAVPEPSCWHNYVAIYIYIYIMCTLERDIERERERKRGPI